MFTQNLKYYFKITMAMLVVFIAQQISLGASLIPNTAVATILFFTGITIAGIVAYKYKIFTEYPHERQFKRHKILIKIGIIIGAYLALLAAATFSLIIKDAVNVAHVTSNQGIINSIAKHGNLSFLILSLLAAPFFEELLFRWFIFEKLKPTGSRLTPFVIATISFAMAHVVAGGLTDLASWITYLPMSIILTGLYALFGDIKLNITVHLIWNAVSVLALIAAMQ